MATWEVRDAVEADGPRIADLNTITGGVFSQAGHYLHGLPGAITVLVVEHAGVLVGWAEVDLDAELHHTMRPALPGPHAEVPTILVDPARRGRGVGAALMAEAEARARSVGCTVLAVVPLNGRPGEAEADAARVRFFEGCGLRPVRPGAPWWGMRKEL